MPRVDAESLRGAYLDLIEALLDGPKTTDALIEISKLKKSAVYELLNMMEDRFMVFRQRMRSTGVGPSPSLWHWCPVPGEIPASAKR